jgi:hypothetical protein
MDAEPAWTVGTDIHAIPRQPMTFFRMQKLQRQTGDVLQEVFGMMAVRDAALGEPLYFLTEDADVANLSPEVIDRSYSFKTSPVERIRETGPAAYLVWTHTSIYRLLADT